MAEVLNLDMLPDWLRDMDVGASVRPWADGSAYPCLTWCGSFTVHGLGFHAMRGTTTDFAMAWPIGNGGWQVLQDAYDIYDPIAGQDGYIEPEDLIDILGENGYSSLSSFVALEGKWWREALTCAVAAKWCRERYSVPLTFSDGHAALSRLVSCASAFYPDADRALLGTTIAREMDCQEKDYNMAVYGTSRELKDTQIRSGGVVPQNSVGHAIGMAPVGGLRALQDPKAKGRGPKFGH